MKELIHGVNKNIYLYVTFKMNIMNKSKILRDLVAFDDV